MFVGIVGFGTVGSAAFHTFTRLGHRCYIVDPLKGYYSDLQNCDVIFVCVYDADGVERVVEEWRTAATVLAIKTTLRPGMTDRLVERYGRHIVYCPEFLTERTAMEDFARPDKVIFGAPRFGSALSLLAKLHEPLGEPLVMRPVEAEILKLALNAHHALKVEYANEIYDICQLYGADYRAVREGLEKDRYVSASHLDVWQDDERGYGGKCLPKDTEMLVAASLERDYLPNVIAEAQRVNALRRTHYL